MTPAPETGSLRLLQCTPKSRRHGGRSGISCWATQRLNTQCLGHRQLLLAQCTSQTIQCHRSSVMCDSHFWFEWLVKRGHYGFQTNLWFIVPTLSLRVSHPWVMSSLRPVAWILPLLFIVHQERYYLGAVRRPPKILGSGTKTESSIPDISELDSEWCNSPLSDAIQNKLGKMQPLMVTPF